MLTDYDAIAYIRGNADFPKIYGTVGFKGVNGGTWVDVDVKGLPEFSQATEEMEQIGPHGFHIHEKPCGSDFDDAGGHYNPNNMPHGNHKGDLPPLFSNGGISKMLVYTDKFMPDEVIGRSIVIHSSPDDFKSQPSGNSGERIACATIEKAESSYNV